MKRIVLMLMIISSLFNNVLITIADNINHDLTINYQLENDQDKLNTNIEFILDENTGFNDETKEYNIVKIVNKEKNEEISSLNYLTSFQEKFNFIFSYVNNNEQKTKEVTIENEKINTYNVLEISGNQLLTTVEEDIKRVEIESVYDVSYQNSIGLERGNNQVRTPLGIILQPNTKIYIREVNPNFNMDLTVGFLTNDSQTEASSKIKTNTENWQQITNGNYVTTPFIKAPNSQEKPIIEYKIEGDYKILPIYNQGETDQNEFISFWESTNAEYAFIQGEVIQLYVPMIDCSVLKSNQYGTIEDILNMYIKMMNLYNEMTGISYDADNKYDLAPRTKYFVKANKHGYGLAYYTVDHTGYNGERIKDYFSPGWMTLHEIAHGYEYRLCDQMSLVEVWNNTLANQYQEEVGIAEKDRWIFGGTTREDSERKLWDMFKNGVEDFATLTYREKLNVIVKVIEFAGKEGYANFNRLYRRFIDSQYVNVFSEPEDQYVLLFSIATGLNLYDYFYLHGLKADQQVKMVLDNLNLENVVLLQQVVDIQTAREIKEHYNLLSSYSLITTTQLNEYFANINNNINVRVNSDTNTNYNVGIYNGTKLIQEQTLENNYVQFNGVKPGKYTIKVLHDNYDYAFEMVTIIINDEGNYDVEINKLENSDSLLLMRQKISLRGIAEVVFAEIEIDGINQTLEITSLDVIPHHYQNNKYASIEVVSATGQRKYYKEYIGNIKQPDYIKLQYDIGDKIIVYHKEGHKGRESVTKQFLQENYSQFIDQETMEYSLTKYGVNTNRMNIENYNAQMIDNYASFIKGVIGTEDITNYDKYLEYRYELKKAINLLNEEQKNNYLVKYADIINFSERMVTITFNSNDQTKEQQILVNKDHIIEKNSFTKEGYIFFGWNQNKNNANNGIVEYYDEDIININQDITLYAVWKNSFDVVVYANENNYIRYHYNENNPIDVLTLGQIKEINEGKVGDFSEFNDKQIKYYTQFSGEKGNKYNIGTKISINNMLNSKPRKEDGAIVIYMAFKTLEGINNYSTTYECVESGGGNVWYTETFSSFDDIFTFKSGTELNQIKNTTVWTGNGKEIVKWAIRLNNDSVANSPRIKMFDVGESLSVRELFSDWGFNSSKNGNWLRIYPVWEHANTRVILQNNGVAGWYYKDLNSTNLTIKAPTQEEIVGGTSGYGIGAKWSLKEGYAFDEWTRNSNGTGMTIKVGENFDYNLLKNEPSDWDNLWRFYPKYKKVLMIIYYNDSNDILEQEEVLEGNKIIIKDNTLNKNGYTFVGWSTNDGEDTLFHQGDEIIITENMKFYQVWNPNKYNIIYDPNGGIGEVKQQEITYDKSESLLSNEYTKEGYTFNGWNTESNGTGQSYNEEEIICNLLTEGSITLYAQWQVNQYTIKFNSNQGIGEMSEQIFKYDQEQKLNLNSFTKEGYIFKEWNTKQDGMGTSYYDGQNIMNLTSENEKVIILYAIWEIENNINDYNYNVIKDGYWDENKQNNAIIDLEIPITGFIINNQIDAFTYSAKLQNGIWDNNVNTNEVLGDEILPFEIFKLELKEDYKNQYDIYYRVKTKGFGWLGWTYNGQNAGSEGYNDYIIGLQIKLVNKNTKEIEEEKPSFINTQIRYKGQIQNVGWQDWLYNGADLGTVGLGLRLESMRIELINKNIFHDAKILYNSHVQNVGWEAEEGHYDSYISDGSITGTVGKGWRVEATQILLQGEISNYFDVYYRTQVENTGWLDWACNGEKTGSAKYARRIETIQIKLVPKGLVKEFNENNQDKVNGVHQSFIEQNSVWYETHNAYEGWKDSNKDGLTVGSGVNPIESIKVNIDPENQYQGNVNCQVKETNGEWSPEASNGQVAGTVGAGKTIEAFSVSLEKGSKLEQEFDIYYRALVDGEWLGYGKNGQVAGYAGKKITAIQIMLVPKIIQYDHDKAYKNNNGQYEIINKE